jgi:hypothetical protein
MPFGADDALAVGGILLAFKGAVDGYLLIESFFEKDNHSYTLALSYEIQKRLLEKWGEFQNINAVEAGDCRLFNASPKDREITLKVLARIKTLHDKADDYVKKHVGPTALPSQSGSNGPTRFDHTAVDLASRQMQAKQKGRVKWSIKNKEKFAQVVKDLRDYNQDLRDLFSYSDAQIFDAVLPSQMLAGMSDEDTIRKLQNEVGKHVLMQHAARLKLVQQGLSHVPGAQVIQEAEIHPKPERVSSRQRFLGCRNFQDIYIEWKPVSNDLSDSDRQMVWDRLCTLSGVLSITDASLGVAPHQGLIKLDVPSGNVIQTWIGLVYAIPDKYATKTLVTLHHIISKLEEPPLGEKFKLAAVLARSLSIFHSANWLHKSFRSDNIVFFGGQAVNGRYPSITDPYITGFDVARPDQGVSIEMKPTGKRDLDYYYHPGARDGATKAFDWYSFGVLMLEIAHWKLIPRIMDEQGVPKKDRQDLEGISRVCISSLEFLPAITGAMFSNVVDICLRCEQMPDGDVEMASIVAREIVQVLARLRA